MTSTTDHKINHLATERRWDILAMLAAGDQSGIDMAREMDVYWSTFKAAVERMDLPEGVKLPEKGKRSYKINGPSASRRRERSGLKERDETIVGLRQNGLPYQTIADMYGISRERVRQIIAAHGADGGVCYLDPLDGRTTCPECGREFIVRQRARIGGYCSHKCGKAQEARDARARWIGRVEQIKSRLDAGKSWAEVAREIGIKNANTAYSICYRACQRYGLDFPYVREPHKNGGAS